jgi:predicted HicB family RNase H-like nuclease
MTHDERMAALQKFYEASKRLYLAHPDWVAFYHGVFGIEGLLYHFFPEAGDRAYVETTDEYRTLFDALQRRRGVKPQSGDANQAERVITVRVPKALHQTLLAEAKSRDTSLNKLCISKLLQTIESSGRVETANRAGVCFPLSRSKPRN